MLKESPGSHLSVYLKGMAMGAADIVPGVSGGTIAFIAGIYERLLNALKSFGPHLWAIFRETGIRGIWRHVDGTFLTILFAGVLTSVALFARLISYLLETYPELVWSFFFGLILGSIWFVAVQIRQRTVAAWGAFILGVVIAYWLTELSPTELEVTPVTLFLSGMVAICAMILPGVSGSFILLILGMYAHILAALKAFDVSTLAIFALGCVTGLLSISHLLSWMLRRYRDLSLALLTGFMLGALNKVWPWKETLEYRLNRAGEEVPFIQANVLPAVYEAATGQSAHLWGALICGVVGILLILVFEKMGTR